VKKLWLLLLPLLAFSTAFAEEGKKLEEIVVTAAKIQESIEDTISAVTIIKSEDIKKMNVEFVTDVLRKVPELNLVQNGGPGKIASVILRGGNSAHTLIMVDGIRTNSTTTGSFDFSSINVDDIERIEIVRGPQSTMYGSEAMAGVINIITKKGTGAPKIETSLEAGSFGTYKPDAIISGGYKNMDYRMTGSYFFTDGISAAKNGAERDSYKNSAFSWKFGYRPAEKVELEFTGKYSYDRTDLDGFDFFAHKAIDDPNFVQYENHFVLSAKGKLYLSKSWEQIFTISRVWDSLKFRDPDDTFNNASITTEIDTIDWQHNFYINDIFTLTAGAEYQNEKGKNVGNFDTSLGNGALYLNNTLKLLKDGLILSAGLRYDDREKFGNKSTYRMGALYTIKPVEMSIRTSYGTGFRAPAFNELFFPFYGNLKLKPEDTSSWEIGIVKDFIKDKLSLSLTYFDQKYNNLIDTNPLTFTAVNIAKAEIKGLEASAWFKLSDNVRFTTGYTHLDTEDKLTGKRLSLRPNDKVNLSAAYSLKDLSLVADFTYVGNRVDSSVKRTLSSYSVVNISSSYRIKKGLTVFARIDNLFDTDYEESGSFNTPGFSIYGGLKVAL
jgi:vitamin B12 transporter